MIYMRVKLDLDVDFSVLGTTYSGAEDEVMTVRVWRGPLHGRALDLDMSRQQAVMLRDALSSYLAVPVAPLKVVGATHEET